MAATGWASAIFNFFYENPYILFAFVLLYVFVFGLSIIFSGPKPGPNPFNRDTTRPPKPLVTDHKERDKVLKQGNLFIDLNIIIIIIVAQL